MKWLRQTLTLQKIPTWRESWEPSSKETKIPRIHPSANAPTQTSACNEPRQTSDADVEPPESRARADDCVGGAAGVAAKRAAAACDADTETGTFLDQRQPAPARTSIVEVEQGSFY